MNDLSVIAPRLLKVYPSSYYSADSAKDGIHLDLHDRDDAFFAVCLGILYAFPIQPTVADNTVREMRQSQRSRSIFSSRLLAEVYMGAISGLDHKAQLARVATALPRQFELINTTYKRIPRSVLLSIARAAYLTEMEAHGDIRRLYERCGYDGVALINLLRSWHTRLDIKSFWLCREMREQHVWRKPTGELIDGAVCCVVDVQVRRALEHLGCYKKGGDLFFHSRMIWNAFREYYDFPLLWFARNFCGRKPTGDCPLATYGWCKHQGKRPFRRAQSI